MLWLHTLSAVGWAVTVALLGAARAERDVPRDGACEPGPYRTVVALVAGGIVIALAVTFLKHFHLLSELARAV